MGTVKAAVRSWYRTVTSGSTVYTIAVTWVLSHSVAVHWLRYEPKSENTDNPYRRHGNNVTDGMDAPS